MDSGGQGLCRSFEGAHMMHSLAKRLIILTITPSCKAADSELKSSCSTGRRQRLNLVTVQSLLFLRDKAFTEQGRDRNFKAYLESIGDSIVCVADDDVVKTHVHTNDPGLAIQKALDLWCSYLSMKIDNMREEHQEKLIKDAEKMASAQEAEEEQKRKSRPKDLWDLLPYLIGEGIE